MPALLRGLPLLNVLYTHHNAPNTAPRGHYKRVPTLPARRTHVAL